jgi:hypothetical protein
MDRIWWLKNDTTFLVCFVFSNIYAFLFKTSAIHSNMKSLNAACCFEKKIDQRKIILKVFYWAEEKNYMKLRKMQIWSETFGKLFALFAHKILWSRARMAPQFCSGQKDALFSSMAVIIGFTTVPPGVVHLRPVRPVELSRLLSDVGRSHPVTIPWNPANLFLLDME